MERSCRVGRSVSDSSGPETPGRARPVSNTLSYTTAPGIILLRLGNGSRAIRCGRLSMPMGTYVGTQFCTLTIQEWRRHAHRRAGLRGSNIRAKVPNLRSDRSRRQCRGLLTPMVPANRAAQGDHLYLCYHGLRNCPRFRNTQTALKRFLTNASFLTSLMSDCVLALPR